MNSKRGVARRRIAALLVGWGTCLFAFDPARAQTVLLEANGDSIDDLFGYAVATAGDVDADGYEDLVVGVPQDGNNGFKSGSARVISGKDGSVLHAWDGNSAGDEFGIAVGGAGDVDQDGFADVIVGAHLDDFGGADTGTATVFSGMTGAVLYAIHGIMPDDNIGSAVGGAGDLNHDGFDDFIVASHHFNQAGHHAGGVFVHSGKDGAPLLSILGNAIDLDLGHSVALTGDVNLDGFADLLCGAHGYAAAGAGAGGAFVRSGRDGSNLFTFSGDNAGDDMGRAAAAAGDVNQDGFPDFLIGIDGDDDNGPESGSARVFSGKNGALLHHFDGDSAGDQFGQSVLGDADFSGDGVPDLVIGAPGDDDTGLNTGSVRVRSGKIGAPLHQLNGSSPGLRIWRALAAADVNADGARDLVVGFAYEDSVAVDAGTVRVYSGNQLGWTDLGSGLSGSAGVPVLTGSGFLAPGTMTELALTNAAHGAGAALVIGFSPSNTPLFGGVLVPTPDVVVAGLPTDGAGALLLASPWPAGVASGTAILFQTWIADAAGPAGYSASNALRAVVP